MDRRKIVQAILAFIMNADIKNIFTGKIYNGNMKYVCVPGLNCYSCPAAIGSCPIGALQAVAASPKYSVSYYAMGLLILFGVVLGRFACGWLCPFGLIQELLHKISAPKLKIKLSVDRILRYFKFGILAFFVLALPALMVNEYGLGIPWFCKYICPVGTLEGGIPLILPNKSLQSALGFLFSWKLAVLVIIIILSIFLNRPFCKYLCPLGAVYGIFNKISIFRYSIEQEKCIGCKKCSQNCRMNIEVHTSPNNIECIRCGECIKICPTKCIRKSCIGVKNNK